MEKTATASRRQIPPLQARVHINALQLERDSFHDLQAHDLRRPLLHTSI